MKVTVTWENKMKFYATGDLSGHKVEIDADPEHGGEGLGARPSELILMGMAGCTALDVISMLQKMRLQLESFSVEVEGERATEQPRVFTRANIFYRFQGENLPAEKVARAVNLSLEKYCGMVNTLKKAMPLTYCLEINGNRSEVRPVPK
ncbi:MAG: putative redox protein [Clostridia bacterium]|nr:putative redox protein [Clostridia bacterium]